MAARRKLRPAKAQRRSTSLSVSLAIQAHPLRAEFAERLAVECLGGRAEIVYDPEPDGHRNPWRTYRLALERGLDAPAGTTHRAVLQDDVYVCDYFVETVEAACAAQPDRVMAFFVAGHPLAHVNRVRKAIALGFPFAEMENTTWLPVVATAWPVDLLERLLDWVDRRFAERRFPPGMTADDELCGRWLREAGIRALATVPSLVEHPDSVFSIASNGRRGATGLDHTRRALYFVEDDDTDPRGIDWTRGIAPVL